MVAFVFLSLSIFCNIAYGAQYALVAGGSGEDHKKENFFAADFKNFSQGLKNRKWQVTTLFDNDTSKVPGSKVATTANINQSIEEIVSKLKQGDQVLITFYAHGRDTTPGFLHRIATEDPMGYSLENISYFADEVKAKGGTLAVLDLSCYSGSTQDINDGPQVDNPKERGCIVTLASEKYVGMGICAGAKTESSFTSTIMKLPDPSIKISLEQHFLDSREKDTTPANLPQISSIPLPLKTFWDFFLSASDPNSIYRENGLSVNRVEASICRLCDKTTVMEYTKEIANLKTIAEKLGNAPLGKELTDKMQDYLKSYKSISQSINSVQRKMGMIPSWGFTEPVLKPFNKISLSRMRSLVNLTEPSVSLTDIKWLDENSREQITKLRPRHHKLAEALNKMGKALGKDWDIYENKKKILVQKAQEVMAAERKLYALHARSLKEQKSSSCQNFML